MGCDLRDRRDSWRSVGGEAMARHEARALECAVGLGDGLHGAHVSTGRTAVESPAEDGVHAVSLALADVPEHNLFYIRNGGNGAGPAALVVARGRVRGVNRDHRRGVASA